MGTSFKAADLDGLTISEAFRQFLLGDPEVVMLRKGAIELDPSFERVLVRGWCYPRGIKEWPLAYEGKGIAGTSSPDSPVGYLTRANTPMLMEVQSAANALASRYAELIELLRDGELQAIGDPVRSSDPPLILKSIWESPRYYLDAISGDLLQVNDEADDWSNFLLPRWRAVMFQRAPEISKKRPKPREAAHDVTATTSHERVNRSFKKNRPAEDACVERLTEYMTKSPHTKTIEFYILKERWMDEKSPERIEGLSSRGFHRSIPEARKRAKIPRDSEWKRRGPRPGSTR